jgi:hypothetical protein
VRFARFFVARDEVARFFVLRVDVDRFFVALLDFDVAFFEVLFLLPLDPALGFTRSGSSLPPAPRFHLS